MNDVEEPGDVDVGDRHVGPDAGDVEPFRGPEIADSAQIPLVEQRFPNAPVGPVRYVPDGRGDMLRPRFGQDVRAEVPDDIVLLAGRDDL